MILFLFIIFKARETKISELIFFGEEDIRSRAFTDLESILFKKDLLISPSVIIPTAHENPDGDGLGSATAVYHYLTKIGKDCRLIIISDLPKEYQFLNTNESIYSLACE